MTKPNAIEEIIMEAIAGPIPMPEGGEMEDYTLSKTQAILTALDNAGIAVVPKEPTKTMLGGGSIALVERPDDPHECYVMMVHDFDPAQLIVDPDLDAGPFPSQQETGA